MTIGIPLTGEDNPPPAVAFGRRGMAHNVRGYMVYGNYAEPNPPARLIEAVANGDVDAPSPGDRSPATSPNNSAG